MKKYVLLFACVFLFFLSPLSAAEDKMRIAIVDLQGKGVSNIVAVGVSNIIRSSMVDTGLFTVIERGQMSEILKEQELQMTGCTDSACAVQIGKLLSAKKILLGDITKLRTAYIITIRVVDVEKGVAEFSSMEKALNEDALDKAASNLTMKLVGRITGKTQSQLLSGLETRTMGAYWRRCIIPGWGQFYADRDIEGYIFSLAFAADAIFAGWNYYNYQKKKKDYEDLPRGSAEFDSKYDKYESAVKMYNISLYVLAGIYVAHWIDAAFFARPDFGKKETAYIKEGPYMRFVLDNGQNTMPEMRMGMGFGYRF
ncbi:MAG: CsgG/HfaB family protein [Spirochaetota bacterium]